MHLSRRHGLHSLLCFIGLVVATAPAPPTTVPAPTVADPAPSTKGECQLLHRKHATQVSIPL